MSQPPGAPERPTMVLRLSVPADGAFPSVPADVAVKVAEYLGRKEPESGAAGEIVRALVAEVAPRGSASTDEITLEFHHRDDELRIEARCGGRSSEARHPLPT